ncbi:MAG: 7,8-didemethyl-8-hydroxy-5-deazariboflavin synthase CofG, partial [Candidatus Bathyarchaeia archaeon]
MIDGSTSTVALMSDQRMLQTLGSTPAAVSEPLFRRLEGSPLARDEARRLLTCHHNEMAAVLMVAGFLRTLTYKRFVTYSRKVFIPLTNMCRDACGYCGFRREPTDYGARILTPSEVLEFAQKGQAAGCKEALLMLGDRPEARYEEARVMLRRLGYSSIIDYLIDIAQLLTEKTSLLPHSNAGLLTKREMTALREFNISLGLMLENVSERLCEKGGPHEFAFSKRPKSRLATIEAAGELGIPFTTGLLIGIGETPEETLDSLYAITRLHEKHGHLQEVIIQNLAPKPGTALANFSTPPLEEMLRTIAVARIILPTTVNLQAPPNLSPNAYHNLLSGGINDWGGVSPVTVDFVNPEAPWPEISALREATVS